MRVSYKQTHCLSDIKRYNTMLHCLIDKIVTSYMICCEQKVFIVQTKSNHTLCFILIST